jgi:D-sedoheptulose 7-phosphate isomerase
LSVCENEIRQSYKILKISYSHNGKLLVAGNGGSAADSNHIVGELMKSFIKKRSPKKDFLETISAIDSDTGIYLSNKLQGALSAISLCNNTALITASLNDVDGNVVFAQQVNGYGEKNDVFLGISTSGNSKDIIYAMVVAKAKGLKTIALTGNTGGKIAKIADVSIIIPETETYKIQELHLPVYHAFCLQLEEDFF